MTEINANEASQSRRGSHVLTILRISVFLAAFGLLVGALASIFWDTGEEARGTVRPPGVAEDGHP